MKIKAKKSLTMLKEESIINSKIETCKETIRWFRTQIEPHDCGWMYTTIDGIKHYITKLRSDKKKIK
jgi:hypothetical protein|tara:strand:- start:1465 stop:1665 length:201 start_codon:yes stop_codon:yes gene_type:complete